MVIREKENGHLIKEAGSLLGRMEPFIFTLVIFIHWMEKPEM